MYRGKNAPYLNFRIRKINSKKWEGRKETSQNEKKKREKTKKKKYLGAGRFPIFVYSVHVKHVRIESKVG
jgi:hypothetical protein